MRRQDVDLEQQAPQPGSQQGQELQLVTHYAPERVPERGSSEHEVENQLNLWLPYDDGLPAPRNSGQRFQRAASFSNIFRTTRTPQHFNSMRQPRVQELDEQPLCHSVHRVEAQISQDGSLESGEQATVLGNSNVEQGSRKRFQRAALSLNIVRTTHTPQRFHSMRQPRIQELDEQPLLHSVHRMEEQTLQGVSFENVEQVAVLHNNDVEPSPRNSGQRFQRAASSSNIVRTTRIPQRFHSLRQPRIQELDFHPPLHSVQRMEEQNLQDGSFESGEQAAVLRNSDVEPGLGVVRRHRRLNSAN